MIILAIDPGKNKCGIAVVDNDGLALDLQAIVIEEFENMIVGLNDKYKPTIILIGDGTGSEVFLKKIEQIPELSSTKIKIVDEHNTTLEGRKLYWQINPPKGWRKLVPKSFLVVPSPVDAYAALAIAKKYLTKNSK